MSKAFLIVKSNDVGTYVRRGWPGHVLTFLFQPRDCYHIPKSPFFFFSFTTETRWRRCGWGKLERFLTYFEELRQGVVRESQAGDLGAGGKRIGSKGGWGTGDRCLLPSVLMAKLRSRLLERRSQAIVFAVVAYPRLLLADRSRDISKRIGCSGRLFFHIRRGAVFFTALVCCCCSCFGRSFVFTYLLLLCAKAFARKALRKRKKTSGERVGSNLTPATVLNVECPVSALTDQRTVLHVLFDDSAAARGDEVYAECMILPQKKAFGGLACCHVVHQQSEVLLGNTAARHPERTHAHASCYNPQTVEQSPNEQISVIAVSSGESGHSHPNLECPRLFVSYMLLASHVSTNNAGTKHVGFSPARQAVPEP